MGVKRGRAGSRDGQKRESESGEYEKKQNEKPGIDQGKHTSKLT